MCETKKFSCGDCGVTNCNSMDSKYPDFCLTTHMDESVKDAAMAIYENETNRKIMMTAADIEHEFYCQYTRLEETIEFANPVIGTKEPAPANFPILLNMFIEVKNAVIKIKVIETIV